jgi:hypothetical protein
MRAIETMTAEFKLRADNTSALLRSEESLFFVVATPDRFVLNDAVYLRSEIARRGITFGGFIVNRVHLGSGLADPDRAAQAVRTAGAGDPAAARLAEKLVRAAGQLDERAREDLAAIERLREETGWDGAVAMLPRQEAEVHNLGALDQIAGFFARP